MSKLNREDFKELLLEWNNLLLEISENEVIGVIGQNDYNTLVDLNRKASKDQNFLQVIINTYKLNQNHTIEDILGLYQNYKDLIAPKWNQGEEAFVDVPGGVRISLPSPSSPGSPLPPEKRTTYDNMIKFFDARFSLNLKTSVYIDCLSQGPINQDFEVIINDSDWIICYPKTIKGSISLSRSFWNGRELEYDKSVSGGEGRMIGKMNWCTSIVPRPNKPSGNMFLNYHRKKNLHMYYCIKKNMNVSDPDRKLCISFAKEYNEVSLMEGQSSVNGNNKNTSEKEFRSYIGDRFDVLFKDAEKPKRLEIDEKAYYESISLKQYKTLRAAHVNDGHLEDFFTELEGILTYSRDRIKIFKLSLAQDGPHKSFRLLLAKRDDLLELDPTGELIRKLAQDPDANVRINISLREDLLQADPTGELIKQLATDEDEYIRRYIAYLEDLLQADPTGNLIKQLAQDSSRHVRMGIAMRKDLLQADPTGELIKQLATDENEHARKAIAKRYDLSKLSSSTNESLLRSYIKYLL